MKTRAQLELSEIRDAIRQYVEEKTGGKVQDNGIHLRFSKADPDDPRESDSFSASVTYTT
ncbi:hypothetical protein [Pseudophaeobacter sp.]|jgi:hypothetical protein|uniref:hypothetical protein n=1 Tax=Pseudophaeobacter sp. TaxID=1971739 RepID=UPI0025CEA5E6|nr:hypothetical protein [uncultured Pseudophaeobacter sp.]